MRVLIIIDSFSFGGAESLLAVLAKAAQSSDLELEVASLVPQSQGRNAFLPVLEQAGLQVRFLDVPRLAYPAAVPRLVRAVRQSGCDVVHAHLGYSAILAPVAARLAGRRCVATLHHVPQDLPLRDRVKERLSISTASGLGHLVLVSEGSRQEFARRYRERPGRWHVIYNGVDLTRFSPGRDVLPEELGIPAHAQVVTIVAALRGPKGHATAVRAWPKVLTAHPEAHLLIVGAGPELEPLRELSKASGVAQRVVLAGARRDIPRLLRASELAALPSYTEALPTALIEAAACGIPAVGTTVGGVSEVVDDGRTGLLVTPGDPEAFADAVIGLLADDERRTEMGRQARLLAESRFDMHAWADQLSSLYRVC